MQLSLTNIQMTVSVVVLCVLIYIYSTSLKEGLIAWVDITGLTNKYQTPRSKGAKQGFENTPDSSITYNRYVVNDPDGIQYNSILLATDAIQKADDNANISVRLPPLDSYSYTPSFSALEGKSLPDTIANNEVFGYSTPGIDMYNIRPNLLKQALEKSAISLHEGENTEGMHIQRYGGRKLGDKINVEGLNNGIPAGLFEKHQPQYKLSDVYAPTNYENRKYNYEYYQFDNITGAIDNTTPDGIARYDNMGKFDLNESSANDLRDNKYTNWSYPATGIKMASNASSAGTLGGLVPINTAGTAEPMNKMASNLMRNAQKSSFESKRHQHTSNSVIRDSHTQGNISDHDLNLVSQPYKDDPVASNASLSDYFKDKSHVAQSKLRKLVNSVANVVADNTKENFENFYETNSALYRLPHSYEYDNLSM